MAGQGLWQVGVLVQLRDGEVTINIGKGIGNILEGEIHSAKRRLWIVSPWISERYALILAKKCNDGVDVRLITSNDYANRDHARALRALSQGRNRFLLPLALVSIGFAILFKEQVGLLVAIALVMSYFLPKRTKPKVGLTIKDRLTDFVHDKVYVVDSRAMIGSANLTNAGMKRNSEALVVFDKASVVDGIAKMYEELEG